jgi:hypothetical protein
LNGPWGLAIDGSGNLYVADRFNNRVREIRLDGTIDTVAGGGASTADNVAATSAALGLTGPLAAQSDGTLFLGSTLPGPGAVVREVSTGGTITTVAGTGGSASTGDNGPATSAQIHDVAGLAVDGAGGFELLQSSAPAVRRVDTGGTITTIAGDDTGGFVGDGGPATGARFAAPRSLADAGADLFVADAGNLRVRRITGGTISTFAGNGTLDLGGDGGPGTDAQLSAPSSLAVTPAGALYFGDAEHYRVRRLAAGVVTTVTGDGTSGFTGDGGPASGAEISRPLDLAADGAGNVYFLDFDNVRVRRITPGGTIDTVAGTGVASHGADGVLAATAPLDHPVAIAADASGNLYIAESGSSVGGTHYGPRVRRVGLDGRIRTVLGNGTAGALVPGHRALDTPLQGVGPLTVDASGGLYVSADGYVVHVGACDDVVTWTGSSPQLADLAIDGRGWLYLVGGSHRVTRVDAQGTGVTVAGTGVAGFSGDGGPATSAQLNSPSAVAVTATGDLYIGDAGNQRVRKVDGPSPSMNARRPSCGGYTMDASGGLHPLGVGGAPIAPAATGTTSWPGRDVGRGVAVMPHGNGGYTLDFRGGLHPFAVTGDRPPPAPIGAASWPWPIARGVAIVPSGLGGFTLDGWGGLHPFNIGSPTAWSARVHVGGYWRGWDIARGVVVLPDGTGGYVLDGWGGLHPFSIDGAPMPSPAHVSGYWRGWDIARGVAMLPDGSGGYVLDGWGGLHPFAVGANHLPAAAHGPYWNGRDVARGVAIVP